jgi:hypothetical protein
MSDPFGALDCLTVCRKNCATQIPDTAILVRFS